MVLSVDKQKLDIIRKNMQNILRLTQPEVEYHPQDFIKYFRSVVYAIEQITNMI